MSAGILSVLSVVIAGAVALPSAAVADEIAPVPSPPSNAVSADALPTVQIDNGVVWAQEIVGDIVFVGGQFSNARPAGAAKGTNLIPRSNILAYNIRTGEIVNSFAPVINNRVSDIAASPDGTKLYVVGTFTAVNGLTRNRVAVFDLPSGNLSTTLVPTINGTAQSVAATNTTLYLGGYFSSVNGSSRARVAAVNTTNNKLLPFRPIVDNGMVQSLAVSPDGATVILSGSFTSVEGTDDSGFGLARVDAVTGAKLSLPVNAEVRNGGESAGFMNLSSDGTNFYGVGWHYGGTGNLEGTFAARWSDGGLVWIEDCHGDTYDVAAAGDYVYTASHKHYCGNSGGFPQTDPWTFKHSTVWTKSVAGVNTPDIYGYPDHPGTPRPQMLNWFPQTDVGSFTGKGQAVWSVDGNDQYVVYGGEFPKVNGVVQQGLVRYAVRSIAPNKQGPRNLVDNVAWTPSVLSIASGSARVSYSTVWDRDDTVLTYRLYKDTENAAGLVDERTVDTTFWEPKQQKFSQAGLTPGASVRYRVTATDPYGNVLKSAWTTVTVSDAQVGPYVEDVFEDGAANYWRLGEATGALGFDWTGDNDLKINGNVTRAASGSIQGDTDTATTFGGGFGASSAPAPAPDTFTAEAWFKTTTTSGGKILGYGNSATGDSGNYDRHLYMENSGRLTFGVHPGGVRTISSTASYNDGEWHHAVVSLGSGGMKLYVDGMRVAQRTDVTSGQPFSGYWRVGGDSLGGWTNQPSSNYFAGTIDDVAIYPTSLSLGQVQSHYVASGRTLNLPAAPTDAYGQLVYNDDPELYWRYDETSGAALADSGRLSTSGTLSGAYTRNVAGALGATGKGITFTQTSCEWWETGCTPTNGGNAYTNAGFTSPGSFTAETWVKTTSTRGGKLIGFGSSQTGGSGSYDRHVYMQDNGRLVFGTWTGQTNTITSPSSYNDGQWHHVVATQGANGMTLYVDGASVGTNPQTGAQEYSGYWRVGGDNTWGSSSTNLIGSFDETAIYSRVLSASEVAAHHAVGTGSPVPNTPPVASYSTTVSHLDIAVDAAASSDSDGSIASYAWTFGDGGSATGATATHTYSAGGTYPVTLTVTDDDGATHSMTTDVTVIAPPANVAPTASFVQSITKLSLAVDASASTDSDGTIASYEWNFGDGATASGVSAQHTYGSPGNYTVTLKVTDDDGATHESTKNVVAVANVAPNAAFTAQVSDLTAAVDASGSIDSDGTIVSYSWNFGDGATATGATATHPFSAPGTYLVALTVTDSDGATGTHTESVTVTAPPVPGNSTIASDAFDRTVSSGWGTADLGGAWTVRGGATRFSVANGVGKLTMPSALTAYADLNGVSSTSTRLDAEFSVDKLVEGQYVSVVGRRVGANNYVARLRLQADGGVKLFLLQDSSAIGSSLTVPGLTIVPGQKYTVSIEVTGSAPTTIKAKVWKSSDAEPNWQREGTNSFAALQTPGAVSVFSFLPTTTSAPVIVSFDRVTVKDPTVTVPPVEPPAPNVAPTALITSQVSGLTVNVDGSGSTDSDGTIAAYAWDFGDGATATGPTASHPYAAAGNYTVTLTVTDDDGATAQSTSAVTVDAPPQPPVGGVVASDEFNRAVAGGWGNAESGGAWTLRGGNSRFNVGNGVGTMTMPSALTVYADLNDVALTNARVDAEFSVDKLVDGQYISVVGRRVGASNYIARLRLQADGGVKLFILQDTGAVTASVTVPGLTIVPGEKYVLSMEVTGMAPTTLKAKVWKATDVEPDWQSQGTNSFAALQAPGAVSLFSFLPNTPSAPVVVAFDKVTVKDVSQ